MKSVFLKSTYSLLCCLFLLGLSNVGAASGGANTVSGPNCGKLGIARDFLVPLRRMTAIPEVPSSGRMPFGPEGMRIETRKMGLVVGRGLVGFGIDDQAFEQTRHLNWTVETELLRVNGRGKVVFSLGTKRRTIGSVDGNSIEDFLHPVPDKPAFYRVDIRIFRRGTDRLLGEYSAYARTMKPVVDLRVVMEQRTVRPGELAVARLVNLGTVSIESVAYDYGFEVEAFTGERWVRVPESPKRGITLKRMQILPPGIETRGCLRYLVPSNQPPGKFRFIAHRSSAAAPPLVAVFEVK